MNKWLNLIALLFATATVVSAESVRGGTPPSHPRAAAVEEEEDLDEEEMREAREEEYYNLYERSAPKGHRNLQSPPGTPFTSSYAITIEDQNIDVLSPQPLFAFSDLVETGLRPSMINGREMNDLLGMKTMTKGVVLDPVAVQLQPQITQGVDPSDFFAGGVQPLNTRPIGKNNFFMTGACTVTAQGMYTAEDGQILPREQHDQPSPANDPLTPHDPQVFLPWIRAQSCNYDLCLGGYGYDCVNFYGGGGYDFNPFDRISMGLDDQSIINNNNKEPMLPPPFDMVILGGTGAYRLVKGTATLTTVAGQTRGSIERDVTKRGSIVHMLQVKSNIPLKRAPTDDGGTSSSLIDSFNGEEDDVQPNNPNNNIISF